MMKLMTKCYNSSFAATATEACKLYDAIPGPKAYPVVGSIPNYLPLIGKYDGMNVVKNSIQKFHEYGPIIKEKFFGHEAVFLFDPEDIESFFRQAGITRSSHVTLKHIRTGSKVHVNGGILVENGSAWYDLRSGSQQALTVEAFKQYVPKVDQYTQRLIQKIGNDEIVEKVIKKDFLLGLLAHNCDVMGYMMFGFEWDCMNDILKEDALTTQVIHCSSYFNRMMAPMDNGLMLWKLFPTPMYKKLKKCSEIIDFIPRREVDARLRNRSLAKGPGILNSWIQDGQLSGKTMTTVLSDLLLAGIDTTSYTLAFAMYNLCINTNAQDKLYEEIQRLTPSGDRNNVAATMEAINQAKYLKQVVKETTRLYPVSVGTSRMLDNPCVIGGYKIPENVSVITMNQVSCRLEKYVERATEFIPERFDADSGFKKIRPFTQLPFGYGPRACIGRRVAEMSMYIFLYRLIGQYEIKWIGDKPLDFISTSLTEPAGPLHFQFTLRKNRS